MKIAIIMAAAMTYCSSATLPGKDILHILHLCHRDFHMRFCGKILRANGCFDPE